MPRSFRTNATVTLTFTLRGEEYDVPIEVGGIYTPAETGWLNHDAPEDASFSIESIEIATRTLNPDLRAAIEEWCMEKFRKEGVR